MDGGPAGDAALRAKGARGAGLLRNEGQGLKPIRAHAISNSARRERAEMTAGNVIVACGGGALRSRVPMGKRAIMETTLSQGLRAVHAMPCVERICQISGIVVADQKVRKRYASKVRPTHD